MTHLSVRAAAVVAATCLTLACTADGVHAQCTTCATPTVAYAPVAVAPAPVVVVPRPGLFDRWRMRRWGVTAPVVAAPAYAAGYAPAYTAAYSPAYTAAYAPTYAASYTPYVSAYAPLQPTTVYRPAVLTPVATQPACTTCAYAPAPCDACSATVAYPSTPCDACSSCSTDAVVDQAGYAEPTSGCSSCGVEPYYGTPAAAGDPATPVPALPPDVGTPVGSDYPPEGAGTIDPGPEMGSAGGSGAFSAPPLMAPPYNGNTASRPTVEVHTAVYRRPVGATGVSTTTAPTRRAVDAGSWDTVPAGK